MMRLASGERTSFFHSQKLKVIHITVFCDPRHIGGTVQRRYIDSDSFDTWGTLPGDREQPIVSQEEGHAYLHL